MGTNGNGDIEGVKEGKNKKKQKKQKSRQSSCGLTDAFTNLSNCVTDDNTDH